MVGDLALDSEEPLLVDSKIGDGAVALGRLGHDGRFSADTYNHLVLGRFHNPTGPPPSGIDDHEP